MADRRLQVFHAVAKHLSFTKAGESLCMTQPAVTFQIRQLEDQFNTRLFDRVHGRIGLTPAGTVAFAYAERILALTAELEERAQELIARIDELGGAVSAIEQGFVQGEIEDAAYRSLRDAMPPTARKTERSLPAIPASNGARTSMARASPSPPITASGSGASN